jgi:hypothetical protein
MAKKEVKAKAMPKGAIPMDEADEEAEFEGDELFEGLDSVKD